MGYGGVWNSPWLTTRAGDDPLAEYRNRAPKWYPEWWRLYIETRQNILCLGVFSLRRRRWCTRWNYGWGPWPALGLWSLVMWLLGGPLGSPPLAPYQKIICPRIFPIFSVIFFVDKLRCQKMQKTTTITLHWVNRLVREFAIKHDKNM